MAPGRSVPAFARQRFTSWFRSQPSRDDGRPEVVLWPDTFNNHFNPAIPKAALSVLEAAGWRVIFAAKPMMRPGWP